MAAADPPRAFSARDSWQDYRLLADNSIDVILEADLTTRIGWISPSVEEVLGWRPEELIGRTAADIVHPDDMPEIGALAQAIGDQARRVRSPRVRLLRKDGGWKALRLRGRPALGADGSVIGHIISMQDTSERDDALRALSVLSEGNRVLARVDDEDDLLQQMCATVAATGQYPLVWYGARIEDERRSVVGRAHAGPAADFPQRIAVSWGDDELGRGPTGLCLRTGVTQVRHDIPDDASFAPWRAEAEAAGLRSSLSLPVTVSGVIDGAFVVYAEEEHAFDSQAISLLETLASDLGLGLERLRSLRALEEASDLLEQQNVRLTGVFNSQFDPFVLLGAVRDDSGTISDLVYTAVSDAGLDYHGRSREEMLGHSVREVLPGLAGSDTYASYVSVVESGEPMVLDDFAYADDRTGEVRHFDIRAVRAGDGVAITFRDVTRRHEAAVALAESEGRYRLLAENSSDVVWQADGTGVIVWASESARTVLGWQPDELIGRDLDVVHPEDRPGTDANLRGLGRGLAVEGQCRIGRADGSWCWMAYTAHRVPSGADTISVVSLRDIDDEVRARDALAHAIGHDPLTGMAARPAMVQRLGEVLDRLPRLRLAAVLCVGVDRLSSINDAYTHAAGDLVLTTLAARVAQAAGSPDLVGRGAGVEFLVLVPDLGSADDAVVLAERILRRAKGGVSIGENRVEPTVSIGIAIGDDGSDPDQLIRDASVAMSQAKADGRDRYSFADASLAEQARRRLEVEAGLREGLSADRLLPYFQPVVDLASGRLTGYEALVRFTRPDGTIAPPGHFMPVAELSPLIADIDMLMLRRSIGALAAIPEPLTVAVNLSTVTLTRPGYAQLIEQLVRESEAATSRLHLEVTETALLGDSAQIVDVMTAVAGLGVRWYVDDFGTGYSSISHLRDLPVSGLKLDVSFSTGIRRGDDKSVRLAQALVGLASGLGLDTVAEGVEDEAEAAVLRKQGWRHGQGWLYGRPAPLP